MGALPVASWDQVGAPGTLDLAIRRGGPSASATLLVGAFALNAPFKLGVLVPCPNIQVPGLSLDATGALDRSLNLANTYVPSGASTRMQAWMPEPVAPAGFSSTNGAVVVAP